jgi:hypothetical protein
MKYQKQTVKKTTMTTKNTNSPSRLSQKKRLRRKVPLQTDRGVLHRPPALHQRAVHRRRGLVVCRHDTGLRRRQWPRLP